MTELSFLAYLSTTFLVLSMHSVQVSREFNQYDSWGEVDWDGASIPAALSVTPEPKLSLCPTELVFGILYHSISDRVWFSQDQAGKNRRKCLVRAGQVWIQQKQSVVKRWWFSCSTQEQIPHAVAHSPRSVGSSAGTLQAVSSIVMCSPPQCVSTLPVAVNHIREVKGCLNAVG